MCRSVAIGYIYVRFGIPEHTFYPAYMYACLRAMSYDALLIRKYLTLHGRTVD